MKLLRSLLLFIVLLSLPALACGGSEPDPPTATPFPDVATDTPAPTQTTAPTDTPQPEPTATEATLPTLEPEPTATTSAIEIDLSDTLYEHPNGYFSLYPPEDWTVEDSEASASFSAPDDSGFIYVQVTDTGYALDGPAFTAYVENREANFFGDYDDYVQESEDVDTENGIATVRKSLTFDGVPQIVVTVYDQYGPIIYSYDFWSNEDLFSAYSDLYPEVISNALVDSDTATEQIEYNWIYTFTGPADLFEIKVPTAWRYESDEGEDTVVDTFYSPDEHAIIQNIAYDDGTEISRSQAGAFGLELLKNFYATDIVITDDQVQQDGSERLIWNSPGGDYSGISFLETRGTTFLLFSVLYDNPFEDVYRDTLEYTISTYAVP